MESYGFYSKLRERRSGSWKLVVSSADHVSSRVVRSSSCTVRIEELGLEVTPGSSSTGYISNVEGVLDRFSSAIGTIRRQADAEGDEDILENAMSFFLRLIWL